MTVDIPCICSQAGTRRPIESRAMRVVDLSSSGVKIKPNLNRTIKTSDYFLNDPIRLDFNLKDRDETYIQKKAYAKHICEDYIGAEFDDSDQDDPIIGSYLLSQRHY